MTNDELNSLFNVRDSVIEKKLLSKENKQITENNINVGEFFCFFWVERLRN